MMAYKAIACCSNRPIAG